MALEHGRKIDAPRHLFPAQPDECPATVLIVLYPQFVVALTQINLRSESRDLVLPLVYDEFVVNPETGQLERAQ